MVEWGGIIVIAEEVCTACNAAGTGSGKVGGVGDGSEDHLGGAEYFPPVGVGGGVLEEAVEAGHGVGSG